MIKYRFYTAVVSVLMTFLMIGCQAENDPFDSQELVEGNGWIAIHITADGKMQTRAPKTLTDEQKNQYLVSIKQANAYLVYAKVLSQLTTADLTAPAGYGYTVVAESCSEKDAESKPTAYGQPRLMGTSASFVVAKDQTSNVNVLCTPANAGVTVIVDETFADIFSDYEMKVSLGSRELTFTPDNASTIGYYNVSDAGASLTYALTATRKAGGDSATTSSTAVLQQGKITQLTLRSTPRGTITLGITYDDTFLTEDIEMVIEP